MSIVTQEDKVSHGITMFKFCTIGFLILLVFKSVKGEANVLPLCSEDLPKEALCKLDSESDPILPPKPWPVKIKPTLHLKSVTKVNEEFQYVTLNLHLYFNWTDDRIALKGINQRSLSKNEIDKIWHPKTWFYHTFNKKYELTSLLVSLNSANHEVMFYDDICKVSFTCHMDFTDFPFDSHLCHATLGDEHSPENEAVFDMVKLWYSNSHNNQSMIEGSQDILVINDTTTQFSFEMRLLEPFTTMYEDIPFSVTGLSLSLSRKNIAVPYITFFIPTGTFAVVSMVSFLIDPDAVPGRMGLIVTLLLISSNVYSTVDAPPTRGFSYIEIWYIGSQIPILFSLFQYGMVLLIMKYYNGKNFKKIDCVSACIIAFYYIAFNVSFWGF